MVAKPYLMSPRQIDILKTEANRMIELKIVEPGESDFMSPLILVEVSGKDARLCIDYRRLNKVTRTQYFPLPNIEELIGRVSAAKYISVLDLTRGYWQIPLSPRAQRYAAFVTTFGTFRPLRLPFGLKNAPYYFSRLMASLLRNCEDYAVPYLDDVAIFSQSWKDHLRHLEDILDRLSSAKLHIKLSKWQFAQAYVKYLGHLVLRQPAELKAQAIKDFPTPTTKTQVRASLGLGGYYRRYIPEFSVITSPLTDLLKGKIRKFTVNWNETCQKAFDELKDKLIENPVLYSPDFTKPFIVQCDASNIGVGVVLSQINEKEEEHPIMLLSKKFSKTEQNYSTTEREWASIIFAVQKLRCYLDGHQKFDSNGPQSLSVVGQKCGH
ncbi:Retrovirus-related Pol polyprotein from transposon 17.6 [Araneus ventricosus]|uniref:RNA-directed DNA polymerase n=1 Tax=Araneus ventricosus TaxID=182803 RepID=A0A4Y2MY57_ARAVE|nr:Retrovirus-related Pol polyprotein from transposon 17.6 [Araneus ventricosus]